MFVIPPSIDQSATGAVYAFALLRGRAPERIVACIAGSIWLWNTFMHRWWFHPHDTYELTIDITVLLVILPLAMKCDRWWLLVAATAFLLRVATDIANFILLLRGWTYGTALIAWGYVFLAALATGTWTSGRQSRAPAQLAFG